MKVVILAGGFGTRLSELTDLRPKPMVEVGGYPLLWHIIKYYRHHGFREFIVACGYKAEVIKRYFIDYHLLTRDLTVDVASGAVRVHEQDVDDWTVHVIDTGLATNTGGRLRRLRRWIGDERFMLTYGDGFSDVDLGALLRFHTAQGVTATVTAVRPPARFGGLVFDGDLVSQFTEKPQIGEGWINGGFMVFEPQAFEYLHSDDDSLEISALEPLSGDGQLAAYRHEGFWQCLDTLRDLRLVERLWQDGRAPWALWERRPSLVPAQ